MIVTRSGSYRESLGEEPVEEEEGDGIGVREEEISPVDDEEDEPPVEDDGSSSPVEDEEDEEDESSSSPVDDDDDDSVAPVSPDDESPVDPPVLSFGPVLVPVPSSNSLVAGGLSPVL